MDRQWKPLEGDPDSILRMVDRYMGVVQEIETHATTLNQIAEESGSTSIAIDHAKTLITQTATDLTASNEHLVQMTQVLRDYSGVLRCSKGQSNEATYWLDQLRPEEEALTHQIATAQDSLDDAIRMLNHALTGTSISAASVASRQNEKDTALVKLTTLQAELDDVRAKIASHQHLWEAAEKTKRQAGDIAAHQVDEITSGFLSTTSNSPAGSVGPEATLSVGFNLWIPPDPVLRNMWHLIFGDGPGEGRPDNQPLIPVDPGILDSDSMDPANNRQGYIGDCWLVSTINGLMETEEGRQFLHDHISWDEEKQGYWITIYHSGQAVTVLVTEVFGLGTQTLVPGEDDGLSPDQGIISLYEAAVFQEFGWDGLSGSMPWDGPKIVQNVNPDTHLGGAFLNSDSEEAIASGGSADGGVTLVSTLPNPLIEYVVATVTRANGEDICIQIPDNHVMEVVGILPDGRIGIRNPWGYWQTSDGDPLYEVIYVTPDEFDSLFSAEVETEQAGG